MECVRAEWGGTGSARLGRGHDGKVQLAVLVHVLEAFAQFHGAVELVHLAQCTRVAGQDNAHRQLVPGHQAHGVGPLGGEEGVAGRWPCAHGHHQVVRGLLGVHQALELGPLRIRHARPLLLALAHVRGRVEQAVEAGQPGWGAEWAAGGGRRGWREGDTGHAAGRSGSGQPGTH